MVLEDSIQTLKGVGEAAARLYVRLGVRTLAQLIDYYPRTYDDYSVLSPMRDMKPGHVTVCGFIKQVSGRYVRRGMHITEAVASDDTGSVRLVWFNQPYRADSLKRGQEYFISGNFELSHQRFAIMNPTMEAASDFPVNTARIVPVYRETKGLTSRQVRAALKQTLPLIRQLPETLPDWLVRQEKLVSYAAAMEQIHFPSTTASLQAARARLGFEEVFSLILASLLNKYEIAGEYAPQVPFHEKMAKDFVGHLPFTLTDAQRKAIWQIYKDMQREHPMNRLVEGDVGSGKTVVAAMAALMVLHQGHQVALMAPTELLARQHAETLARLLAPMGMDNLVGLLVGGMSAAQKRSAHDAIAAGHMRFIVGTHALIQDAVDMHSLELIIIDEQHRFGVEQRKVLQAKAGHMPHVLHLTATPIPRSLALTLYGELDVSILDAKPAGRQPVATEICSPNSRAQLNERIAAELTAGRQAFVVCPLITESAALELSSAEEVYERMSRRDFKQFRVGLLHGKMKAAEKNDIMQAFVVHELDVLVSTTVIEVGVDVPNASVMLIEAADRFGLAQIHQLRGRVGRGQHKAYCFLMMSDAKAPSARMRALERTSDGFRLAELDLKLRGPGAIYGTMQHGQLDLRIAQLTDTKLIMQARAAAERCIERHEDLTRYAVLSDRVRRLRAVTNLN
ncbi:MAG TPA: ATP-dependent DNA helicase RecG [Candidatus Saccharimonadales bacterium]|nr:ATP-dependent DNA helicase RecG [Candidatus Saccharimonadales bacterium]